MTRTIDPSDGAAWTQLFEGITRSAYRLEGLQTYSEPLEADAMARFLRGEPHGLDTSWWRSMVRHHREAGRTMQRVRVVSEPLTDYTRFELAVYPNLAAAGEDIRILVAAPDALPQHDYWLIDDQDLWLMHYEAEGRFLGTELEDDDDAIAEHRRWRDAALAESVPLDAYPMPEHWSSQR